MKFFVIFLVLISILSFTASNSVYGLSCDGTNVTQSFAESDVVFAGQVISKEYVPSERSTADGKNDAITQFLVTEKFKGISQETILIISSEWMWGFNFTKNLEYVVFAYNDGQNLRHQTCTPTSLLEHAELEQIRQVAYDHILSPLKQFKSGIVIDEIQCRDSLILVTKHDGSPACVKLSTVDKLTERGWVNPLIITFSFCGADGFDSQGNLNKNNSTHHWDENECNWEYVGSATNSINKWFGDVPENDKWCDTELIVKTKEKIDQELLKLILLDEIAKFGEAYDMPDRDILLIDMGKNKTKISIEGSWNLEQGRPDIVKTLTELIFIDHVEEYHGRLLVSCQ